MPEYVDALNKLAASQEHISASVTGLAGALVRSNEEQERRSKRRFTAVYRALAGMMVAGLVFAVAFMMRQQIQIDTLRTVVDNQQAQLDNQYRGIADRNRQFDVARNSDLCSQRLNAAFFGVLGTGAAEPMGSVEREKAVEEFRRIGELMQRIDELCYGPNPDTTPLDAVLPPVTTTTTTSPTTVPPG